MHNITFQVFYCNATDMELLYSKSTEIVLHMQDLRACTMKSSRQAGCTAYLPGHGHKQSAGVFCRTQSVAPWCAVWKQHDRALKCCTTIQAFTRY